MLASLQNGSKIVTDPEMPHDLLEQISIVRWMKSARFISFRFLPRQANSAY